jgi:hypothetical protein
VAYLRCHWHRHFFVSRRSIGASNAWILHADYGGRINAVREGGVIDRHRRTPVDLLFGRSATPSQIVETADDP